ncbi:unnamed protein product [Allacma fusca]|uniref:Uncharacterized protein n=1 Tax=Allacma fusca TaxID=39272 RepID=A0A8J2KRN4_9HEXA|nr:unnamed protein product [Allacma fusca]
MDQIPVIDFAKIAQEPGKEQNWEEISEEVRKACHGIGFMHILNHGIRKETIESAFEESKKFFQLPQSRKNDFPLNAANKYRGYTRSGQELLSPNSAFEYREAFSLVGINSPQKFPEELPTFQKALFDLEKECNSHFAHSLDSMGGLEVRNAAGHWTPATPIADTVLVNLGDIMEIWTGGYFKATGHRVLIPEEEIRRRTPRQSIAYFVQLDDDWMITPLKSTENYKFKDNFESMSYAEFLDKRIGDTYQY